MNGLTRPFVNKISMIYIAICWNIKAEAGSRASMGEEGGVD
jgi:hypothetical protein